MRSELGGLAYVHSTLQLVVGKVWQQFLFREGPKRQYAAKSCQCRQCPLDIGMLLRSLSASIRLCSAHSRAVKAGLPYHSWCTGPARLQRYQFGTFARVSTSRPHAFGICRAAASWPSQQPSSWPSVRQRAGSNSDNGISISLHQQRNFSNSQNGTGCAHSPLQYFPSLKPLLRSNECAKAFDSPA